jgi:hypothetical protein
MGSISTRLVDGVLQFVASYLGPGPDGTYRPSDAGSQLAKAVEATPGATIGEHRDLGSAVHWGDEVDYEYECLLEITAANVAALLKSEFNWEEGALAIARGYVSPPEALDCIRALQARANRLADRLAELSSARGATTERPPARWWQFWRR